MNKSRRMFRQGDILILAIDSLPEKAAPQSRTNGRVVLAYGEATGHAHAISDEGAELFHADNDEMFLRVDNLVRLRHEEHAEIKIPPGAYRVVRQREYQPERIWYVSD